MDQRVYLIRATAEMALKRDDLFVLEKNGEICGTGIINSIQVDDYRYGNWQHNVSDDQICVLHTLVISPACAGRIWSTFIEFYEKYALEHGCPELRIDTNAKNTTARSMYKKYGYVEVGIVPTDFNGIVGI